MENYQLLPNKSETLKTSVTLLQNEFNNDSGHIGLVSCFTFKNEENSSWSLFSGGRDGTIRQWSNNKCINSIPAHNDWVSSLYHYDNKDFMISGSHDKSVKIWKRSINDSISLLHSFAFHNDFVSSVAGANDTTSFVSVGLDRQIGLWDLTSDIIPIAEIPKASASLYTVDINTRGNLIVYGGVEKIISGWDSRSDKSCFDLYGHRNIVKIVKFHSIDSNLLISGGCDNRLNVWDLRMHKLLKSFESHSDSVWDLNSDIYGNVWSSGRDGRLFITDIDNESSTLVSKVDCPILKFVTRPNGTEILMSTDDGNMYLWKDLQIVNWKKEKIVPVLKDESEKENFEILNSKKNESVVSSSTEEISTNYNSIKDPKISLKDALTFNSVPNLIKANVLPNKYQILTMDSKSKFQLWDITHGNILKEFDDSHSFDLLYEKLSFSNPPVHYTSWFEYDIRMGYLEINLKNPKCFDSEIYTKLCGLDGEGKIIMGQSLIESIFRYYSLHKLDLLKRIMEKRSEDNSDKNELSEKNKDTEENEQNENNEKKESQETINEKSVIESGETFDPEVPSSTSFHIPKYNYVTISDYKAKSCSTLLRKKIIDFDGLEPDTIIPFWVTNWVLFGKTEEQNFMKLEFYILPLDPEVLPAPHNNIKLNSPKVLPAKKILKHIIKKLNLKLPLVPLDPEKLKLQEKEKEKESTKETTKEAETETETETKPKPETDSLEPLEEPIAVWDFMDLYCKDVLLHPEISLAAIKSTIWKSYNPIELKFKRKEPYLVSLKETPTNNLSEKEK